MFLWYAEGMNVTREKECFCHTCKREFHYLGITRHRAAHRKRFQDCKITFTHGDTYTYDYSARAVTIPTSAMHNSKLVG